jgi:hypothetical protein
MDESRTAAFASDSPHYATRVVDQITRKAESLARFPLSGHVVPEYEGPGNENRAVRQILKAIIGSFTESAPIELKYWQ